MDTVEVFASSSRGGTAALTIIRNIRDLTMDCFATLAMTAPLPLSI
jgi:hypothetical protein